MMPEEWPIAASAADGDEPARLAAVDQLHGGVVAQLEPLRESPHVKVAYLGG